MPSTLHTTSPAWRDVLLRATARLKQSAHGATPRLDAEVLLAHVLSCPRDQLYRQADAPLSAERRKAFEALLQRRLAHEPIAYITGEREFWSLTFSVTPEALIPRPETEHLVDSVLEQAARLASQSLPRRILDVGTGSGIIAISLAVELADWQLVALDNSRAAVRLARRNARRLLRDSRVHVLAADVTALPFAPTPFAIVAANLPYVPSSEVAELDAGVRDYEPTVALDGGPDGLRWIRHLLHHLPKLVVAGGALHLEIGHGQEAALGALAAEMPWLRLEAVLEDLAGLQRVVVIRCL